MVPPGPGVRVGKACQSAGGSVTVARRAQQLALAVAVSLTWLLLFFPWTS
jgi:hypothetical protein